MVEYSECRTDHNSQGFTLIEVMIALVILTIGVLGVLLMQLSTVTGNSHAMAISQGIHEVSAGLDMAESLDIHDPALKENSGTTIANLFRGGDSICSAMSGIVTYAVQDLANTAAINTELALTDPLDTLVPCEGKIITMQSRLKSGRNHRTVTMQYTHLQ